ncbi:glutamate--tRNA ligase [bacterium]|nr:glutamate--tRNA ligase [bacterium]
MAEKEVRVRFAPSPTGYLHVGGARTALYNWLYARKNNGKFILRIEDTDRERSTEESIKAIIDSIKWMGLDWDEGPVHQADRLDLYKEYAYKLVDMNKARKVDDETEAVIFNFPDTGSCIIDDMVHGRIEFDNKDIKDQVLIKSDGYAAYNFACVIDDALMNITHVIRGDDHISNTPKQIAIYKALGFDIPKFAHIPLIMGKDNTRLSKRHGATSVSIYKDMGYLPEAFNNYLALLGWSAGDNKEIFSIKELVEKFSLKRITGKSAIFDTDKLDWLNGQYIKNADDKRIYGIAKDILARENLIKDNCSDEWLSGVVGLYKKRMRRIGELAEEARFFFVDDVVYDQEAYNKYFSDEKNFLMIKDYIDLLSGVDDFSIENLEVISRKFVEDKGISSGDFIHPLRLALTGKTASPGIFEVLHFLGKEKVIRRLETISKKR